MRNLALQLNQEGQIGSLTGLRAIAAGIVVLHHLVPAKADTLFRTVLEEFNIGVTIFFVLSGFLITYRYYGKYEKGKSWFYNYVVNRVARIYPMYFLLTSFTYMIGLLTSHPLNSAFATEYLLNITFLRGFFSEYVYSGIAQGWTLTIEECFYFSAPFIFLLADRVPIWIQAVLIFCSGFLIYLVFRDIKFHGFMNSLPHIYITTFFGRVFEFTMGIMTALFFLRKGCISKATLFGGIGFLVVFALQVYTNYTSGKYSIQTVPGFFLNTLALSGAVAISIFGLITEETWLKKILQSKCMVLLGKSSYTLYLLHWGMTGYLIHRFVSPNFLIEIVITYFLSIVLWYFIEEPSNRLIKRLKHKEG